MITTSKTWNSLSSAGNMVIWLYVYGVRQTIKHEGTAQSCTIKLQSYENFTQHKVQHQLSKFQSYGIQTTGWSKKVLHPCTFELKTFIHFKSLIHLYSPLECLQPHIPRHQSKVPARHTNLAIFTNAWWILLPPKTEHKIWVKDVIDNLHRTSIGRTWKRGKRNSLLLIRICLRHWILSILPPPETHKTNHQYSSHPISINQCRQARITEKSKTRKIKTPASSINQRKTQNQYTKKSNWAACRLVQP